MLGRTAAIGIDRVKDCPRCSPISLLNHRLLLPSLLRAKPTEELPHPTLRTVSLRRLRLFCDKHTIPRPELIKLNAAVAISVHRCHRRINARLIF